MLVLGELSVSLFQMQVQLVHLADNVGLLPWVLVNYERHIIDVLLKHRITHVGKITNRRNISKKVKQSRALVWRLAWYTNHFKALTRWRIHRLQLTTHLSTPRGWKAWPGWLTSSGWFTHISGHPSAEGWACYRESSPAKTDVLATVPRHQPSSSSIPRVVSLEFLRGAIFISVPHYKFRGLVFPSPMIYDYYIDP